MLAMYQRAPETPNGRAGIRQSSSPVRSSPLNPNYRLNNPPSQRRASLHNHLHTQSRYTRPVAPNHGLQNDLFSTEASEDPKKAVWREAFRRKCAERAQRDRVDYRVSKRIQAGSDRPEESDALGHVVDEDQDTEYGEGMEDEVRTECPVSENAFFPKQSQTQTALQCSHDSREETTKSCVQRLVCVQCGVFARS
jgi:hypothetical protein